MTRYRLVVELDYNPKTDSRKQTVRHMVSQALAYHPNTKFRRPTIHRLDRIVTAAVIKARAPQREAVRAIVKYDTHPQGGGMCEDRIGGCAKIAMEALKS